LKKHALGCLGAASAEVIAELEYDLPATYKHHKYVGFNAHYPTCHMIVVHMHLARSV
jgi:hypothetical protein